MKRLLFAFMIGFLLLGRASAGIVFDEGLVLQNGADEIVLRPGQIARLSVRDSFWRLPRFQNLRFANEKPSVAWVDERGRVHAALPGQTAIYVSDGAGRTGTVLVKVSGGTKLSRASLIVLAVLFLAVFMVFACLNVRFFERK